MTNSTFSYIGSELELFSQAINWKRYLRSKIGKFLGNRVLEVGAGIGSTTVSLCKGNEDEWLALEPDPSLLEILDNKIDSGKLPTCCKSHLGSVADLPSETEGKFNSILYIDVLEHINEDFSELERASQYLAKGGFLIVLAPAHQWLYTPFDEAIGHYRRYSRSSLLKLGTNNLRCVTAKYLDSIGLLASLANKLLLKSSQPTQAQIKIWDQYMVTLSKLADPLLLYSIGKSILVIWQK